MGIDKAKPKETKVVASQTDYLRMFYLMLRQNDVVSEDKKMTIPIKAFQTIPTDATIHGEIEDGILSVWIKESRADKRRKKKASKKILTLDKRLIIR